MAVTLDSTTFDSLYLRDQPVGYESNNVIRGRTARSWTISGLVSPSDWYALLGIYDTWRDARILEEAPTATSTVGSTVSLSVDGPGNYSWNNVDCWFSSAPAASQNGSYLEIEFSLVDAAQQLQIYILEIEDPTGGGGTTEEPDLGTYTIGSTVLTLRKPIDTFANGPALELTAGGTHYITGPLVAFKIKDIEGETDAAGWAGVLSWYESQIIATPSPGSYFPVTAPTASAERRLVGGVPTDIYTVSIQLGLVI
jgi:hypothetical protein